MKAVIWTDTLQAVVMLAGMVSVFIKTSVDVGGLSHITEAMRRSERLNFGEYVL